MLDELWAGGALLPDFPFLISRGHRSPAWAELIKEPQAALTADGWVGVRNMPAKGGRPDLPLEEFSRAVAYMARAAGAKWTDPDAAMMKQIQAEEKKALDKKAKEAKETKGKK